MRGTGIGRWLAPLVLGLTSAAAVAAPAPVSLENGRAVFEALAGDQQTAFEATEARYVQARQAAPDDIDLAIAHCDFYWHVWDIDGVDWTQPLPDKHRDCLRGLEERWPDAPQVQLFIVSQRHSDQESDFLMALWERADDWTPAQRGELAHALAQESDFKDRGRFALEAVELGHGPSLPDALRHVARTQGTDAAVALATRAPLAKQSADLDERLRALLELPRDEAAADHLARHKNQRIVPTTELAVLSLTRAGDLDGAAAALANSDDPKAGALREARLQLALARGDGDGAAAEFEFDGDAFEESLANYLRILHVKPLATFTPGMLPMLFGVLAMAFVFAMMPLMVVVPAHYFGMFRRVSGRVAEPLFPGLGLRHAWYAMAMASIILPMAVLGVFRPELLQQLFVEGADMGVFEITAWSTLAGLVALSPLLLCMSRDAWWGRAGDLPGLLARVLGGYALVFALGVVITLVESAINQAGIPTGESTFQRSLLTQGLEDHGVVVTFLIVALLVPVFEEWMFRGVLLGALQRHVGFAWANLVQASLFMLIHDDVSRFPLFLAIGLVAGWLVKRYGYLLPAILLHVLNNAVAVWLSLP